MPKKTNDSIKKKGNKVDNIENVVSKNTVDQVVKPMKKTTKRVAKNAAEPVEKATKRVAKKTAEPVEKSTKRVAKKTAEPVEKSTKRVTKKTSEPATKVISKSTVGKTRKTATRTTTSRTSSVATKKTTSKTSTKKSASRTKTAPKRNTAKSKKTEVIEYYDLPYRYNQTIVKILAQTPNTIFVYWDISDSDREKYINEFGEDFFEKTVPVLIVHNKTKNYTFEIEVNDFANSWYFNIDDPKADYEIEFGRRAKQNSNIVLPNNYVYVTSSNAIEVPNNHILFEKNQKVIFFKNVKNNSRFSKEISSFNFMQYMGKVYNLYDVYKKIYKAEELQEIENNPSSKI